MRCLSIPLLILLAVLLVIMLVTITEAPEVTSDGITNYSVTPTLSGVRTAVILAKVPVTPVQVPRIPSGEVVFPITRRTTPTPTIPRATLSGTSTLEQTTVPFTPAFRLTTTPATPTSKPTTITITPTFQTVTLSPTPTVQQTSISVTTTSQPATAPVTPTVEPTTIPVTQPFQQITVPVIPISQPTTVPVTTTATPTIITVNQTTTTPIATEILPIYRTGPVYRSSINSGSSSGSLTVASNPSGAVVYLDGYNYETTPWVFTGLTTGYHTVEVNYPGYEAFIQNVYLDDGASSEVYADLIPLSDSGSLFVDSTPQGAEVYVDGNSQGQSPVMVNGLSAGAHQIELHLAGYEVLASTEYVAAGQETDVNLLLTPYSGSSLYGSIDITTNIPGALVYLDGVYKGVATGNTFNIISVDPGSPTLLLHLPGYTDITQVVDVYSGQISKVDAVFSPLPENQQRPIPSSPSVGGIIVTSTPAGGQVYVDNQFRGITPVTIYNVSPGTHIINVNLAGYTDWSTSIDIQADQIVQVPVTLLSGSSSAGGTPVPTRAGLSPVAIIGAFVISVIVLLSYRHRR